MDLIKFVKSNFVEVVVICAIVVGTISGAIIAAYEWRINMMKENYASLENKGKKYDECASELARLKRKLADVAHIEKTDTVIVYADPASSGVIADFYANHCEGYIPLTVEFIDESIGEVTSWQWDFGDGNTSDEKHPKHMYAKPGAFDVSLEVGGPQGSHRKTRNKYIAARPLTENFIEHNGINIAVQQCSRINGRIECVVSLTNTTYNAISFTFGYNACYFKVDGEPILCIFKNREGADARQIAMRLEPNDATNLKIISRARQPESIHMIRLVLKAYNSKIWGSESVIINDIPVSD